MKTTNFAALVTVMLIIAPAFGQPSGVQENEHSEGMIGEQARTSATVGASKRVVTHTGERVRVQIRPAKQAAEHAGERINLQAHDQARAIARTISETR